MANSGKTATIKRIKTLQGALRHTLRGVLRGLLIALCWFTVVSVVLVLPLRWINPFSTSFIIRDIVITGEPVHVYSLPLEDMGDIAPMAVIASEDQKFAHHHGFDVQSLKHALQARFRGQGSGGASTISQQVAKNLWLWPEKQLLRKGLEAWFTVWLELFLPKARILELYLNIAEFGDRNYGIEAASQHFFNVSASELTQHQASLLATSLPNPRQLKVQNPSNKMQRRARWIVRQMRQLGGARYIESL